MKLDVKELIAKLINTPIYHKSGSGTVANTTIKQVDTLALGPGKWLVFSDVTFTSGTSGNSQGQNRLRVSGVLKAIRWVADIGVVSPPALSISEGNETVSLEVFVYAGGSSNSYSYNLYAIEIG